MTSPEDITHPRRIKTYVRRAGRSTVAQTKALAERGADYLVPYQASAINFVAAFDLNTAGEGQNLAKSGFGELPTLTPALSPGERAGVRVCQSRHAPPS